MDLNDLKKGNSVNTTLRDISEKKDYEICYVHVGRDMVGVGAFFDDNDQCKAAIITDDGKKKVIKPSNGYTEKTVDTILKELEEGFDTFNDQ